MALLTHRMSCIHWFPRVAEWDIEAARDAVSIHAQPTHLLLALWRRGLVLDQHGPGGSGNAPTQ